MSQLSLADQDAVSAWMAAYPDVIRRGRTAKVVEGLPTIQELSDFARHYGVISRGKEAGLPDGQGLRS